MVVPSSATQDAVDMDPTAFLPTYDDFIQEREDIIVMVERILVTHLTCVKPMAKRVRWHIQHAFSTEMKEKSHIVNLGQY